MIVNWIPHCIRRIEDPETKEGGIQNFVEAGRKLAGATDARHVGAVFANTWVFNTLESIYLDQLWFRRPWSLFQRRSGGIT